MTRGTGRLARRGIAGAAAVAFLSLPLIASKAAAGEYTLYAKAVSTSDWTNPNGALGTPLCGGPCPCSNGDYAWIAADNNDPLIATDFDQLSLAPNEVVLDVRVNAIGRFEPSQAGAVRLIVGGLTPTNQTLDIAVPAQAGSDCNYFLLPDGWSIYSLASPSEWPAKINANLTFGVRSIQGTPTNTLACKALRVRVITGLANDECAGAINTPEGLIPFSTLSATDSADPVDPECGASFSHDIWFRYVAPCSGVTTLSTCDLVDFDAALAVYPACGSPHPIACDTFSCEGVNGGATLTFDAVAGADYFIRLGGLDGDAGSGFLGIFCQPGPVNDECDGAITLPDGLIPISTLGATDSPDPVDADCADSFSRDIWFRYIAPCTGVTTLSTCDLVDFDAALAVYPACGSPHPIACDTFSCEGVNGGATLTFDAVAGADYFIRLGGLDGDAGSGFLGTFCQPGPVNDECAGAITLPDGLIPISTLGATDSPDPVDADCADSFSRDIWFRYIAPCTGVTTLSTCDLVDFDAALAVYPACGSPHPIACDAFSCKGLNGGATLSFDAVAGADYFIRLGGLDGDAGTGFLGIFCSPAAPNDECTQAILVTNGATVFSTEEATSSSVPFPVSCTDSFTNDIWYRYIATCTGTAMLSTCGTVNYDSVLAVYQACASSIAIACNDQACGGGENSSMLSFAVVAGEDYLIRVGGYQGDAGSGSFTITCETSTTPPSNDNCAAAKVLAIGPSAFTTIGATAGGPVLPACVTVGTKDVWYRHVATCTGELTITACGLAPVQAVVYSGGCLAPTLLGCGVTACANGSTVTANVTAGNTYLVRLIDQGGGTTGTLTVSCTVPVNPDLNGDGVVGAADLSILLGAWGAGGPADFDLDGHVDADDLATLLGAWGS